MADILIIDDDPDFRRIVAQTLSAEGHEISEAKAGIDGIAAFHARHPALVIIEIMMSAKLEIIHELRREAPDLQILALSGNIGIAAGYDFDMATILGANAVLEKSFNVSELSDTVEMLLLPQRRSTVAMAA